MHSSARVLMLAAGVDSPSVRFRLRQYLPYLQAQGIQAEIGDLSVSPAQRRAVLARCGEYDVVLVHRALLRTWDYWHLKHYARSYVFDFDDAIMFRDSPTRSLSPQASNSTIILPNLLSSPTFVLLPRRVA